MATYTPETLYNRLLSFAQKCLILMKIPQLKPQYLLAQLHSKSCSLTLVRQWRTRVECIHPWVKNPWFSAFAINKLPKTVYNIEYGKQLIRSSASPGANYIEAVEASSRKDFIHRLKISRKEVKESVHWLNLIQFANTQIEKTFPELEELKKEAHELIKIFTSSILTSERNRENGK